MLELISVSHRYGDVTALTDVSIEVSEGTTGLIGMNGAGKSTLLSILSGATRPGEGRVRVGGVDLYGSGRRSVLPRVAFMPQIPLFPANFRAQELVSYIGWMRGLSAREADSRAHDVLEQVGLSDRSSVKMGKLSGGMQRRVALAQALVAQPKYLLLDEPSTGLDPAQRRQMVNLLAAVGTTTLLSSHVMEDVTELAERVLVLHEGRVRFDGTVAELSAGAPAGTSPERAAEAGFLRICMEPHG